MGRCQKHPTFDFRGQFSMSKIIRICLNFFFIEIYQVRRTFFDNVNFQITLLLKRCLFLTAPYQSKTQNSIISFGCVDSYAKIFLILYPPLENSTTHIAIRCVKIRKHLKGQWAELKAVFLLVTSK